MLLGIPISQQPHNYFPVASIVIWILQLLGVYYGKASSLLCWCLTKWETRRTDLKETMEIK